MCSNQQETVQLFDKVPIGMADLFCFNVEISTSWW